MATTIPGGDGGVPRNASAQPLAPRRGVTGPELAAPPLVVRRREEEETVVTFPALVWKEFLASRRSWPASPSRPSSSSA